MSFEGLLGDPVFNFGIGMLGNNQTIGKALLGGSRYVNDVQRQNDLRAYNMRAQELLDYKYNTDRMKAEAQRNRLKDEGSGAAQFFKAAFPGADFKVNDLGDDYQLTPIGMWDDGRPAPGKSYGQDGIPIKVSSPPINFGAIKPEISGFLGLGPEDMQGISMIGQADPKTAMRMLENAYKQRIREQGHAEPTEIQKFRSWQKMTPQEKAEYKNYKEFTKSGGITINNNLGEPKPVTMPDGSQGFVQFPKSGGEPVPVQGALPPAGDSEQMAAGYGQRMEASEQIIKRVGPKGYPNVGTSVAGSLPGSLGRYTQSLAMTPEQQMHRQAQEDWVRAKLRKESGAVIHDEEMEREIATYFPKPGDTQQVIQQKERARDVAIQAMNRAAGPLGKARAKTPPAKSGIKFLGFE